MTNNISTPYAVPSPDNVHQFSTAHRNSSSKDVLEEQLATSFTARTQLKSDSEDQVHHLPSEPNLPKEPTVGRAPHRGPAHAESKPSPNDGHGAIEKVDARGPPQPNWEIAEQERRERTEDAKRAEEEGRGDRDYPEQLHAGQVGFGPAIGERDRATLSDKFAGFKEVVSGKLRRNPELAETGRRRMTGELKHEQREHDEQEIPFHDTRKPELASSARSGARDDDYGNESRVDEAETSGQAIPSRRGAHPEPASQ